MNDIEIQTILEVIKILDNHLTHCKSEEIEKAKDILDDLIEYKTITADQRWPYE